MYSVKNAKLFFNVIFFILDVGGTDADDEESGCS